MLYDEATKPLTPLESFVWAFASCMIACVVIAVVGVAVLFGVP
jgi:hypothetical protein